MQLDRILWGEKIILTWGAPGEGVTRSLRFSGATIFKKVERPTILRGEYIVENLLPDAGRTL